MDSWIANLVFQEPNQSVLEPLQRDRSRNGLDVRALVLISASGIYWLFDLKNILYPSGEQLANSSAHGDPAKSLM